MFDFLKRKKPVQSPELIVATESVLETVSNTKNYPKEVLEIHHEFSIAAETLLTTAKSIIDEASTKDISKVNRLEKLGFKQVGQVTELKPLIQKAEISKEQIELLKHYQREYPLHKFITEEQVKAICYKWNLICGDVGRFKGFVPEKNLRDIEKFTLKEQDKGLLFYNDIFLLGGEIVKEGNYYHIYKTGGERKMFDYAFQSNDGVKWYGRDDKNIFGLINLPFNTSSDFVLKESIFQICAPIKDMDTQGMEISDGYKLKKHFPDPVVLQPVKGGYLIVTAWGDEASDENVVNQKFN